MAANGDVMVDINIEGQLKLVIQYKSGITQGQTNVFNVFVGCPILIKTAIASPRNIVIPNVLEPDKRTILNNLNYCYSESTAPWCIPTYSLHSVSATGVVDPAPFTNTNNIELTSDGTVKINVQSEWEGSFLIKYVGGVQNGQTNVFKIKLNCPTLTILPLPVFADINPPQTPD